MAKSFKKLELNKPEFSTRANNFFNLMNVKEFQQKFFENPVEFTSKELRVEVPKGTRISKTNQSVFKLLSDPKFNSWAEEFQKQIETSFPDINDKSSLEDIFKFSKIKLTQEKFKEDFASSIIHHLNPKSYEEIIKGGIIKPGVINAEGDVAIVLLTFVVVVVVITVAAGVAKPNESLNRIKLNLVVNQIEQHHLNAIKNRIK